MANPYALPWSRCTKNRPPRHVTTPRSLPAHPIADAVPYAPLTASLSRLNAQFVAATGRAWTTTVATVPAGAVCFDNATGFEPPLSHAPATSASTTAIARNRDIDAHD